MELRAARGFTDSVHIISVAAAAAAAAVAAVKESPLSPAPSSLDKNTVGTSWKL